MFRPQKPLKKTRIKLYSTLTLPVLLYGSETWTVKASDARRITAAEMKYMRRTAGYTWTDYKCTNAQIVKELKVTPILDKLLEYKRNWIQHVNRMPRNRLPRVMKHYSPTGRRNHGRPLKRLLHTWDRNGSTSGPTPLKIYDDDNDDDDDKQQCQWHCCLYRIILCYIVSLIIVSNLMMAKSEMAETCSWYGMYNCHIVVLRLLRLSIVVPLCSNKQNGNHAS